MFSLNVIAMNNLGLTKRWILQGMELALGSLVLTGLTCLVYRQSKINIRYFVKFSKENPNPDG